MAQEYGSVSIFSMGRETIYGTAATGNFLQLAHVSVDGGLTQDFYVSEALQGNRNRTRLCLDEKTGSLTVVLLVDVRSVGFVLSEIFGLPVTTADTPSAGHHTHVWKVPQVLPIGCTYEAFFDVNDLAIQYLGGKIESFSFSMTPGGALKITLTIRFQDAATNARIDAAPYKYAVVPLQMAVAELYEAGVEIPHEAPKFDLNFTNTFDEVRCVGSDGVASAFLEGWADVTFSMSMRFKNWTMYQKAFNGTESSLKAKFPSPKTHASHFLQFELPEVNYKVKSPGIPGPGGINVDLDGMAYLDDGIGGSSIIVTAVNDVANYTAISA